MIALSNLHKTIFIFMLVVLATLQTSCGFHLRGESELADQLTPMFLDLAGTDDELGRAMQDQLTASGENMLALSRLDAKTELIISSVQMKQRVAAVDDLGRAREYELNYQFRYELKKITEAGAQTEIIKTNTVKLTRNWIFDPANVLAVSFEKEALYKDMRKQAVRLVLRQLVAIK